MLLQRRHERSMSVSGKRRHCTAHPPGQWGADPDPQAMRGQSRGCGPRGEQTVTQCYHVPFRVRLPQRDGKRTLTQNVYVSVPSSLIHTSQRVEINW